MAGRCNGAVAVALKPRMDLRRALIQQESPPPIMIRSRHENACAAMASTGSVSLAIQVMPPSSASRVPRATASPNLRASAWRSTFTRPTRTAMNTRLSIPSTISSAVSVRRPAQICGSLSQSISASGPDQVVSRAGRLPTAAAR